jgi:hypothetical protein
MLPHRLASCIFRVPLGPLINTYDRAGTSNEVQPRRSYHSPHLLVNDCSSRPFALDIASTHTELPTSPARAPSSPSQHTIWKPGRKPPCIGSCIVKGIAGSSATGLCIALHLAPRSPLTSSDPPRDVEGCLTHFSKHWVSASVCLSSSTECWAPAGDICHSSP